MTMTAHPPAAGRTPDQVVVEGVTVAYDGITALDDVHLSLAVGEQLAVVGPSGCGKSTLVKVIAGLVGADAGRITIAGDEVAGPGRWVPPERRGVGVVFQDHALFPHLTVANNIAFGLRGHDDASARVDEVLALVGLTDKADRYPHELSGGEQQRTALARALAPRPAVLLLDEPFSNLDRNLRERVRHETVALLRTEGMTAIFVTHDRDEALTVGSRVAVVRAGQVEQVDTPEVVYHAPATRFVATFLDEAGFVPGTIDGDRVVTRFGPLVVHPAQDRAGAPVAAHGGVVVAGSDERVTHPAGSGPPVVDVMVRPHEVLVQADPDGNGVVTGTEFRGGAIAHAVALDAGDVEPADAVATTNGTGPDGPGAGDGLTLVGLRPHTQALEVGTRVSVSILNDHALTTFPRQAAAFRAPAGDMSC